MKKYKYNGKEELFCQGIVLGKTKTDAYIDAYGDKREDGEKKAASTIWNKACLLSKTPKIKQRIEELEALRTEKFVVTKEKQAKKLEIVAELAIKEAEGKTPQYSAAVSAYKEQSKLYGLYEPEEVNVKFSPVDLFGAMHKNK